MNWTEVEGKWKQIKGSAREKWGKLTDDDLTMIAGRRDQFLGKLQERYGISREQAQKDLDAWMQGLPATDIPRTQTGGGHM